MGNIMKMQLFNWILIQINFAQNFAKKRERNTDLNLLVI